MNILTFIFIFFLGSIVGSFCNVVIYRLGTGKSFARGRSICMSCNKKLEWYELVPIFSFLIQKGRCRSCASQISNQYPIVEILTGIVFVLTVNHFKFILPFSTISFIALVSIISFFFCLLIIIAVYDIRHTIIPNKLSYLFAGVAFLTLFINFTFHSSLFFFPPVFSLLSGPLIAAPFALIWYFSKGKYMGLGDAKLLLGIGWMVGLASGIAVVILAFWIGAIVSIVLRLLYGKKITRKTELPFAPFLIIGVFLVVFLGIDIFTIISWFSF